MLTCIVWPGYIRPDGYGVSGGRLAHRIVYERSVGPIPVGFEVDHMCFNSSCVNLEHLRILPARVNRELQRSSLKTHCVNGHEYTPENTYVRPVAYRSGRRDCRACIRDRARKYRTGRAA